MKPISPEEVLDLGAYERSRDDIRARAMAARALRRVAVGPNASLMFECRETVRYQIQEMLRAERIAKPDAVAYEIQTYSELLPGPNELAATLFLEFDQPSERKLWLARLRGLESQVFLVVDSEQIPAQFDPRQIDPQRVSAVQFVRFPLTPTARDGLRRGVSTRAALLHPSYRFSTELTRETVAAIWRDLEEAAQ